MWKGRISLAIKENPYFEVEQRLENFNQETDYTMTAFSDRIVESPLQFEVVDEWVSGGKQYMQLAFSEGAVIEEGTDLSERNLGNLDVGVAILYEWRKWVNDTLLAQMLKTDGLELTTLNGMIANAYGVTFDTAGGRIQIVRGHLDQARKEVWS